MSSLQVTRAVTVPQTEHSFWYAVHTRSRHEKRIAADLVQKGITTFLPLVTESRQWSDRRMKVELPLFSCYVFVNITPSPDLQVAVLHTMGILGFVGGNRHPISIPWRQIEDIQTILSRKVPCAAHPFVEVGQRVRIRGGALDGVEGVLTRFSGSDRLVISVQTIQRSLSITVEGYDIEVLDRPVSRYV